MSSANYFSAIIWHFFNKCQNKCRGSEVAVSGRTLLISCTYCLCILLVHIAYASCLCILLIQHYHIRCCCYNIVVQQWLSSLITAVKMSTSLFFITHRMLAIIRGNSSLMTFSIFLKKCFFITTCLVMYLTNNFNHEIEK